jgi:hypothetical protein
MDSVYGFSNQILTINPQKRHNNLAEAQVFWISQNSRPSDKKRRKNACDEPFFALPAPVEHVRSFCSFFRDPARQTRRSSMRTHQMLAALTFLVLIGSGTAQATIVTYYFSGTVNTFADYSGDNYIPSSVKDGSSFVGYFSYDNSATQVLNNPGIYRGTSLNLAASVTIAGLYTYTLGGTTDGDEIDLLGTSFGLYGRGPTVYESFSPNPPFSFFSFGGTMSSSTTDLSSAKLVNTDSSAGLSDALTDAPYYFIGGGITEVVAPEPSSLFLVGIGAGGFLVTFQKRRRQAGASVRNSVA